jgi:hypothetical protein
VLALLKPLAPLGRFLLLGWLWRFLGRLVWPVVGPLLRSWWVRRSPRVKRWLTPAPPAPPTRPAPNTRDGQYDRSFLIQRLIIGWIGISLPFALWLIDWWLFGGKPHPRGSESVYYYSGMRELFTVGLATVAFFLLTYKIAERNLDNTLSIVAGVAGLFIPFFPTAEPKGYRCLPPPDPPIVGSHPPACKFPYTDLQHVFSNHHPGWTAFVHYPATAVFIAGLGGVMLMFGLREGKRPQGSARYSPRDWRGFHFNCVRLIVLAAIWIVVTNWVWHGGPRISMLIGEGLATFAFGASWFAKGAELKYRRVDPGPPG